MDTEHPPIQPDDIDSSAYHGMFSNNKSSDFVLKVLFVLFQFLVVLFLTAWYITRKNFKIPTADTVKVNPTSTSIKEFLKQFNSQFVQVEFHKKKELMFIIGNADIVYNSQFVTKLIHIRPHLAFDDWQATTVFSINYEEMRIVSLISRFAIDDLLHTQSLFSNVVQEAVIEAVNGKNEVTITYNNMMDFVQIYFKDVVFGYSHLCDNLQPDLDSLLIKYLGFYKSAHLLNPNINDKQLKSMQQSLHTEIKNFIDHFISDTHSSLADKAVSFAEKFIKEKASFDLCGITDTDFVTANHMLQDALDFASMALSILPDLLLNTFNEIGKDEEAFANAVDISDNLQVEAALQEVIRYHNIGSDLTIYRNTSDLICCNFDLPIGSLTAINLYSINNDCQLFDNPKLFKWSRFPMSDGDFTVNSPLQAVHCKNSQFRFCMAFASAAVQSVLGMGNLVHRNGELKLIFREQ